MKKIIYTLALCLFASGVFALRGMSELNLKLYDNSLFYVVFDNVTYNLNKQTYTFQEIVPGNHYLTVVKIKPYMSGYGYSYQPKTVFSGYIYVPSNQKIFSMINSLHKFVIINSTQLLGSDDVPVESMDPPGYYNLTPENPYEYYEEYYNQPTYSPVSTYTYSPVISTSSFASLCSIISNSSFDSSKQTLAKQAIASNWFTSIQVCEMIKLFTFESSKLAIAKLAYAKTIDKSNYFIVNNAFTFNSSIEELSTYIAAN